MHKLDVVTLLCLDTRDPEGALRGMQRCMEGIEYAAAVFLTHDQFRCDDARVTVKAIPPLRGIEDYSRFMIKEIGQYFSTSHVLVVQWDGFVVNPERWDNGFLKYDYIGAPWVNSRHPVGNGGFSLRSRKLVDALQDPAVRFFNPEDYAICDRYHDLLVERYGINFAPASVASHFSCETHQPPAPTFGVHGIGSVHWVLSDQAHLAYLKTLPDKVLLSDIGRTIAKDCLDTQKPLSLNYILKIRASLNSFPDRLVNFKLAVKQLFNIRRERFYKDHFSDRADSEADNSATKLCFPGDWFKQHVQRDLILHLTGQYSRKKATVPAEARKVLWFYDWHMLGDCVLDQTLREQLSQQYQIDICIPAAPTDIFDVDPLFHKVYRSVNDCPKNYDFVLLNDVNSRSIRLKLKKYFAAPWSVLVEGEDLQPNRYNRRNFVSSRLWAIFQGHPTE